MNLKSNHVATNWRSVCVALLCLLALIQPANSATADPARRVALVIGNAAYADSPLTNPGNDARDMAQALTRIGFNVTMLTDRNRAQMTQAIRNFGLAAAGAETALFYFAGHGVQVRGKNYLIPTGQRFADESEVEADAVDVNTVLGRMEQARASVSVVILAACRNNPLARDGRNVARGLARMEAPSGALVAFAAQPGAEAIDGSGRNGLYTKYLLRHIETAGLTAEQMFKRVRADVERESGRRQSPREETSLTGADFFFKPVLGAVVAQAAVLKPEVLVNDAQIEQQAWSAAQSGNTAAGYSAYLEEYPKGRFAAAARVARASLGTAVMVAQAPPVPQRLPSAQAVPTAGQIIKDCADCPEMVVIPAGSFDMGSNENADEQPVHRVEVPAFLLGRTEVTQGQWISLMGSNPSNFSKCGASCPVESISWNDAQEFARRLSQKTGKAYRLPSEAEWEYAARAGSRGRWSFGDVESQLGDYAWSSANSVQTQPVARKKPNAFGLHDMHGNVWEWVQDIWHINYLGASSDASATLIGDQSGRALRSGSWTSDRSSMLRSAYRNLANPGYSSGGIGMRLARTN